MPSPDKTSWVILAGGEARRMGGKDKGLLALAGKDMIEHVYHNLRLQTRDISINANRNTERYACYGQVFKDKLSTRPGPLGGIHAAFEQLNNEWIGFVPCDCPHLPVDLVARMTRACDDSTDIAVAHDGTRFQPVVALINRRIKPKLNNFLADGGRKIMLLYKSCNLVSVDFSDTPHAFINLNTPEELAQFGRLND